MTLIINVACVSLAIYLCYKILQRVCLKIMFVEFKNENKWYCKFLIKYAPQILGFALGHKGVKVEERGEHV